MSYQYAAQLRLKAQKTSIIVQHSEPTNQVYCELVILEEYYLLGCVVMQSVESAVNISEDCTASTFRVKE
jgi:hypothetical protein